MGVDIDTYRGRIGSFNHRFKLAVNARGKASINFDCALKCVGSVVFVGLLLVLAGIEPNPGPSGQERPLYERVLSRSLPYLVEKLQPHPLLDYLQAKGVLPVSIARDIKEEPKTSDVTRKLIWYIRARDESLYITFKKGLKSTGQKELAEKLNVEERKLNIERQAYQTSDDSDSEYSDAPADQTSDDTDSEYSDAPGYVEPIQIRKDPDVERIIQKFGLEKIMEQKIQITDVVQLDVFENSDKRYNDQELPFIFLQHILSCNSGAFNYKSYFPGDGNSKKGSVNSLFAPDEANDISPLDLFVLVYQCCDPLLQQLLFQKLYLAKIALPFMYSKYPSSEKILSLWPLRFLLTETTCKMNREMREVELLDLPCYNVTFTRFGRPMFSKSNLTNNLLCDHGTNTFFHTNCPLGMTSRYASHGYVEMFFIPYVEGGSSKFDQSMLFLNARGDFGTEKNFSLNDREFISSITDTVVVIIDLKTFVSNTSSLERKICRFSSVLLLFVSEINLNDDTKTKLKDFESYVVNHYKLKLHIIATHSGTKKRNATAIISDVKSAIQTFIHGKTLDLETIGSRIAKSNIKTDETFCCKEAFESADSVIAEIGKTSPETNIIEAVTPVQSKNSKLLGTLIKESYRNSSLCAFDDQTKKIPQVRQLKGEQITPVIKLFSKCLAKNRKRHSFLKLYLSWLKILLERRKRLTIQNYLDTSETFDTEENAFLEIEHFFREIAHICDSIKMSGTSSESIDFPHVNELVDVVSSLMVQGYIFELLDGEHFFIPTEWIKLILGEVNRKINEKQLIVLSVLGIRSSGKSTLLNTMFGLQFPTSCGRCTRGIHMRLVPLVKRMKTFFVLPYDYILVIDTEGIRAPEFLNTQESYYKRDNELSTIIAGLGDVTILNVMGESISEMHDVLQILAHAFLRLKLANNSLDIRKNCFLIHQNVSEMHAPMMLKPSLAHALQILDKATKEAAEFEGISDITTFYDVIKFERDSNVFYFPNLWHGNPPMASINRMYCDRVNVLTTKLFKESLYDREKSFKTLEDIATHVHDLWKGVLAENFIFSFRNNIEKKAYIELDKFIRDTFWLVENSFDDESLQMVQKKFSKCDDYESLKRTIIEIPVSLRDLISKHKQKAFDEMELFFQKNKYKEMTIRWKEQSLNRLDMFCKVIVDNRNIEIDTLYNKRKVDIMITKMCSKHEDELRKKSIELANELRISGTMIDTNEHIARFDQIWKVIETESLRMDTTKPEKSSLRSDFKLFLQNVFESHIVLLNQILRDDKFDEKHEIKHLSGSFVKTEIDISDISMPKKFSFKQKKSATQLSEKSEKKLKLVQSATEEIFSAVDIKVQIICQKNEIITNREVKQILNEIYESIEDISTKHSQHYTLKITYKIKVLVHVSKYLLRRFEAYNMVHQQYHSLSARLDSYRKQMQERFFAYLEERKAEDTAASLMHGILENVIRDNIEENLTRKVKWVLKDRLPPLKYFLLLNILSELIDRNDFDQCISYILYPKGHAFHWVTKKANKCLFTKNIGVYLEVAEKEIINLLKDIEHMLKKSTDNFPNHRASFKDWIEDFISINDKFTFPNNCFNNVAMELEHLDCVQIVDFVNKIFDKLEHTKKSLVDMYRNATQETVRWNGCNPIYTIFEDIWGCPENCMFCGEPCIRSKQHDNMCHTCLQHRPLGISGVFVEETGDIFLTSCHMNVTGDGNVPCSFINFRCNPHERSDCKDKRHTFKKYKSIVSTWDIEPVRVMEDCSLFWMKFMGKYKQQLGEYYGMNTENIPSTWNEIQDKRAVDSLGAAKKDRIGSVLK